MPVSIVELEFGVASGYTSALCFVVFTDKRRGWRPIRSRSAKSRGRRRLQDAVSLKESFASRVVRMAGCLFQGQHRCKADVGPF